MRAAAPLRLGLLVAFGALAGAWARPEGLAQLPDGRPIGGRLGVELADASPVLRAELPWANRATLYGWGSVRLSARPRQDELRVRVVVDAPAARRRWAGECDVHLAGESGAVSRHAAYVGQPMEGGASYDAIRIDLPIEEVRRLAAASGLGGSACGDPLVLGPAQLATLRAFLAQFDELATERRPSRATEAELAPGDLIAEDGEPLEDAG